MPSKSAKDLAFEKERAKYRKQIRELESVIDERDVTIRELNDQLLQAEGKCSELQDWINRLLEYTEMSEEDMRNIIQKEKDTAELMEHFNALIGIGRMFGGTYI